MKTWAEVPGALGSGNVSRPMFAADLEACPAVRTASGGFPRPSRPLRQAIRPTASPAQPSPAKTNRSPKRIAPFPPRAARQADLRNPFAAPQATPGNEALNIRDITWRFRVSTDEEMP